MPPKNPLLAVPLPEADEVVLRAHARSLRAAGRSPRTVQSYGEAGRMLAGFLVRAGTPGLEAATRADVEAFMAHLLDQHTAAAAAVRFRSLRPLFGWMVDEGYVDRSPMAGMTEPAATAKPVPVTSDDDLRALVKACAADRTVYGLRDVALVRLLIDDGMRVAELCGLQLADVDMRQDVVTVRGKGDKVRILPFGARTGQALERYLRARAKHPLASSSALWVGARGRPLTPSGVTQMLERRCADAGIDRINPHRFRHTAAHVAAGAGMGDSDMMRLFGWSTRDMVARYGSSAAEERAREAHRRLAPGDRI